MRVNLSSVPLPLTHQWHVLCAASARCPYMDRRKMFADPTQDELFYLLTGETEESLQVRHR